MQDAKMRCAGGDVLRKKNTLCGVCKQTKMCSMNSHQDLSFLHGTQIFLFFSPKLIYEHKI
jgi:hypothetical protein